MDGRVTESPASTSGRPTVSAITVSKALTTAGSLGVAERVIDDRVVSIESGSFFCSQDRRYLVPRVHDYCQCPHADRLHSMWEEPSVTTSPGQCHSSPRCSSAGFSHLTSDLQFQRFKLRRSTPVREFKGWLFGSSSENHRFFRVQWFRGTRRLLASAEDPASTRVHPASQYGSR